MGSDVFNLLDYLAYWLEQLVAMFKQIFGWGKEIEVIPEEVTLPEWLP